MKRLRHWIPSTSALLAFESAARYCNFSRAAEELNTSQSAISRHIAGLEELLSTRLFDRQGKRLKLTDSGTRLFHVVVSSLDNIQSGALAIARSPAHDQIVLTCSHEISHLFLMPRFEALQQAMGDGVRVRVMTYEYDTQDVVVDPNTDLLFTYGAHGAAPEHRAVALQEAVIPVCSPAYARAHRDVVRKSSAHWASLSLLDLTKHNRGWATWDEWFERAGRPARPPAFTGFENYVYLLEAAVMGRGIALGWRHLVDGFLKSGALVTLADNFLESDRALHVLLTEQGRERALARRCLSYFAGVAP